MNRRRVGIMGGTFDPIHVGHLILGESAYHQFNLEEVLFMPSGNPPHKRVRQGRGSLEERIEMIRLAIADNPHFTLSLAEAHEEGYSYTKVTLEKLTAEHPDTDYYFIMGADSLFNFEEWKEPERIAALATIVAAGRNHVDTMTLDLQAKHLEETLNARIHMLSTPNIDISSHMIREWIRSGKSIRYYVPRQVISYIKGSRLYQNSID